VPCHDVVVVVGVIFEVGVVKILSLIFIKSDINCDSFVADTMDQKLC
jgi:hypothetical protein